jgi:cytochrome c-type biogenesis protein
MIASLSPLSMLLALGAGVITVLSPCVLPVLPLIVGRSLQSHRWGPAALVAGLVSGFAAAGSLLGIGGQWLPGFASSLRGVAIAVLLGLGLLMIFPKLNYRVQGWLQLISRAMGQAISSFTRERGPLGRILDRHSAGPALDALRRASAGQYFGPGSGAPPASRTAATADVLWDWGRFASATVGLCRTLR